MNSTIQKIALALAVALVGTACDPFPAEDKGPLRITSVRAVNVRTNFIDEFSVVADFPPVEFASTNGTTWNLAGTLNANPDVTTTGADYNVIVVQFNKSLDPASVLSASAAIDSCTPGAYLTATPAATAPARYYTCYTPQGLETGASLWIFYSPAAPAAANEPQFDAQFTAATAYALTGTGVRDYDGNAVTFTVNFTTNTF